jgi:hypothetical protein
VEKMADEQSIAALGREGIPTPHLLRAAIETIRVLDREAGTPEQEAHYAYTELPTGGIFQSDDLIAAESILLKAGLIHRDQGYRLRPTTELCHAAALAEEDALEALLFMILEKRPPIWLAGAASDGEFHDEAIPDDQISLIAEIIPDLARREALLLAAGRRHDQELLASIGLMGEEHVVDVCREELNSCSRPDLADRVERVSVRSDQLGWDIDAPRIGGGKRKLEVKTTRAQGPLINFHLSRNEARVGINDPDWALVFCRVDRDDQVRIVGWCQLGLVQSLLPTDQDRRGRWESVVLTINQAQLEAGLPPAD